MFKRLTSDKKRAIKKIKNCDEFILVTTTTDAEMSETQRCCNPALALNTAINMVSIIKPLKEHDELTYQKVKQEIIKELG